MSRNKSFVDQVHFFWWVTNDIFGTFFMKRLLVLTEEFPLFYHRLTQPLFDMYWSTMFWKLGKVKSAGNSNVLLEKLFFTVFENHPKKSHFCAQNIKQNFFDIFNCWFLAQKFKNKRSSLSLALLQNETYLSDFQTLCYLAKK